MSTVQIFQLDAEVDGQREAYQYRVKQNGKTLEVFEVADYADVESCQEAAKAAAARLEASPWVSPFTTHHDTIMGYYGTAARLRSLVMSLWNGAAFPFELSCLGSFDSRHYAIALDLIQSYRRLGENDEAFMALADEIRAAREAAAAAKDDDE